MSRLTDRTELERNQGTKRFTMTTGNKLWV